MLCCGSCCAMPPLLLLLLWGALGVRLRCTLLKAVTTSLAPRCTASASTLSLLGGAACLGSSGFWAIPGAGFGWAFADAFVPTAFDLAEPVHNVKRQEKGCHLQAARSPCLHMPCKMPCCTHRLIISGSGNICEKAECRPLVDALLSDTLSPANAARSCSWDV